ncbi:MAG TPA: class I SAM-dependent methyltransferase [Polyangiaceae bacterium]
MATGASSPYLALVGRARDFLDLEQSSLTRAMRVAAPLAAGRLLDVGCGTKPYEPIFRPHVREYVGVEYGDWPVDPGVSAADAFYTGDRLPFEDGAFDTVLCNQVGEHVPDPRAFFGELVRVLRSGGRLVFTVPFSYRIHAEPNDYFRFTRYALQEYARTHGLRVDVLAARGGMWSVVGQKVASHIALRYGRLGGDLQRIGGFAYVAPMAKRPRYWALPVVAPAVVAVVAASRVLDRVDHDESDTLGYLLVATKGARG